MQKSLLLLLIAFFINMALHAQTTEQIDTLEARYLACIDKGDHMLGCTSGYYEQMDSMLNAVYKNIILKLDATKKQQLRTEQRKWLAERDKKFKQIEKEEKTKNPGDEYQGQDSEMFIVDKKAKIVNERTRELIRSFSSILSP
jgi:uncharacterized protein YecT (DUF1311 family)